ncbi:MULTISPECIES: fimbrial protein [Providencia]|uniref:fimbrial protein n=1 Tax=Providencia TaxID=586 RepID=UPI000F4A95BA|nr:MULTISPECIES: type 1 fimbrial protein [Providencia]MBG5933019.1 type 1 fimbrial protein [Providencia rettgeri]MBS0861171.1 type 1 fimbrial protein [Providencia rettgeri]MBS0874855.1 type 1 fimbrial protein [Providencia rettgeri]MBS0921704.1 type 1 fimbrial protein [Providencia rettgeri]MCG5371416.1 type 1 fimbrial protein [Providencia rettgeri]
MNMKIVAATLITLGLSSAVVANAATSAEVTLQGAITNSTCNLIVNGGKSTLNMGVFKGEDFKGKINQKVGSTDMPVSLTGCTAGETGTLIVQGMTSVKNNDQNIFVNNDANTVGFMVTQSDGSTIVKNGQGVAVNLGKEDTTGQYTFKVGMASTTESPIGGAYTAPILVAYIVN